MPANPICRTRSSWATSIGTSGVMVGGSATSGPIGNADQPSPSSTGTIDDRPAKATAWPARSAAVAIGRNGS